MTERKARTSKIDYCILNKGKKRGEGGKRDVGMENGKETIRKGGLDME